MKHLLALPYEIWRGIKGYEGLYQVSNFGRVRSLDHYVKSKGGVRLVKGTILKPIVIKHGNYKQVVINLYKDGIKKRFVISRLVGITFPDIIAWTEDAKGKPFEEIEIDHINTDSTDNRLENLCWVTVKEQHNNPLTKQHMSDAMKGNIPWDKGVKFTDKHKANISNALKGKYCGSKNPHSKRIRQLTKDGMLIKIWDCLKDAVDELGISQPNISLVLTGHHKTAGGYGWEYTDI